MTFITQFFLCIVGTNLSLNWNVYSPYAFVITITRLFSLQNFNEGYIKRYRGQTQLSYLDQCVLFKCPFSFTVFSSAEKEAIFLIYSSIFPTWLMSKTLSPPGFLELLLVQVFLAGGDLVGTQHPSNFLVTIYLYMFQAQLDHMAAINRDPYVCYCLWKQRKRELLFWLSCLYLQLFQFDTLKFKLL